MTTPTSRLGAFALILAGVFATAYGIGEAWPGHQHTAAQSTPMPGHEHGANGAGAGVAGLSSLVDGHRIVVDAAIATGASSSTMSFRIERDGHPVTAFDNAHGARLHLLLVSADLSSFQHLHPIMDPAGTWTTPVEWSSGGAYRMVADIHPTGSDAMALGTDLRVVGTPSDVALPAPSDDVTTPEGLHVRRDGGTFTVTPTDGLEPYLGQSAHLVAFRSGNSMYRHLHASDGSKPGEFTFAIDLPRGTWRLFLQFSRLGQVTTVPFTVEVAT